MVAGLSQAVKEKVGECLRILTSSRDGDVPGPAIGERAAGTQPRTQIERNQRFAQVGIAAQEDRLAFGETFRPQKGHQLGNDLIGRLDGHERGCEGS
jgi:hypothetical protein